MEMCYNVRENVYGVQKWWEGKCPGLVHFPSVHLQTTIALQYKTIVAEILYYTEILYYILSTCATIT